MGSARKGFRSARINPDYDNSEPRDTRGSPGPRKKAPNCGNKSSDDRSSNSVPEDDDVQKLHNREIYIKCKVDFTIACEVSRITRNS